MDAGLWSRQFARPPDACDVSSKTVLVRTANHGQVFATRMGGIQRSLYFHKGYSREILSYSFRHDKERTGHLLRLRRLASSRRDKVV